ncbi:MAG TPA: DNA modification methylase [Terriglobia bacterium]|nr:DNA modification methylase [Terriglobia bacterium]
MTVLERAKRLRPPMREYAALLEKCFPAQALSSLQSLLVAWEAVADETNVSELTWLTLASILRECSPVGTAQWQYVLPKKEKAKSADPYQAFAAKVDLMCKDMVVRQHMPLGPEAVVHRDDARLCSSVPDGWADLVVTSPPYANNYDYADATRLEMTFFGEVSDWRDLQKAVRTYLVRSCTQHAAPLMPQTSDIVGGPLLRPIQSEISQQCELLSVQREKHGGRKPYHTMIAAYFTDMANFWVTLRRVTAENSLVCLVVGDSAPYGVHIPVDQWLGRLAVAAGFGSYHFEKTRDRNVKWKNRKHRVPLQEGRLWVQG